MIRSGDPAAHLRVISPLAFLRRQALWPSPLFSPGLMAARDVVVLSALLLIPSSAAAQSVIRPRLAAGISAQAISAKFQTRSIGTSSSDGENLLGGISAALIVSRRIAVEAEYRESIGGAWGLRTLGVGLAVRARPGPSSYMRFTVASLKVAEPSRCEATETCPGTHGESRPGFEVMFGVELELGSHFAVGPRFSWAQSLGALPSYRLFGLGVQVVAF